jgi:AGCS family alanine or glycine:cation symporter
VLEFINGFFGTIVAFLWEYFLGFDVLFGSAGNVKLPFIIIVLGLGGLFFTIRFKFMNVRFFKHAIDVVRGKYDNPNDEGEISHFKALTSALSATVGLGNIAGVAVAIGMGGPGAVFWMWLVAFCGMAMKFSSCTLAQLYRRIKPDGSVLGGPMVYLEEGLKEKGLPNLGKFLAILFAFLCILASFGGGNMFQGNQMGQLIGESLYGSNPPAYFGPIIGIILAILVALVIIGGIKRIASLTSKMVPAMCLFYSVICLIIIFANFAAVPAMFANIFNEAFNSSAIWGGFLGVLVQGMKRAAFSNEAGLGSAAIAHAAAKTDEPVREGIVASLGPFIDTIIVCTMTALALLITNSHTIEGLQGVSMTAHAFGTLASWLPYALTICVIVFAYSTMISWSYYGEKSMEYLFGESAIPTYRIIYCILVALGPVLSIGNVLDFSDLMLLSMAFPNIIGMVILSQKVKDALEVYSIKLNQGIFKTFK